MSGFFRIALATALLAGVGSVAQAESRRVQPANSDYYALSTGDIAVERASPRYSATVPPSETGTVMGLRVPR